ncbi:hypothetical protein A2482_01910 [Candidatus Falkowbacteria bacterium RIFOXYC2_FULL_48_21]|uniref:Uncharacterized protein n=1 Tax=Candidatus Falkowbacteria bacterium RIFOXYC2_FULL_48_21 TaxID=1798005 RepID=A0A1F5T8J2_9BACT|nr:MAG: hypothetical protein A2482_01910 [Candidatus Falkowbacteria bacterium RIFOXYC2_FULL_48_21]
MTANTNFPEKPKIKSTVATIQAIFRRWGMLSDRQRRSATLRAMKDFDTQRSPAVRDSGWSGFVGGKKRDDDNVL